MKNTELFFLILKQTKMLMFIGAFLVFFFIACGLIMLTDPSIHTYQDALWFGFMVCTTIGFGDFTVVHPVSRLIAAFLGIYGIILTGFVCGVAGSYLFEKMKQAKGESYGHFIWQLEHLDQLNSDQIKTLQKKVDLQKKKQES